MEDTTTPSRDTNAVPPPPQGLLGGLKQHARQLAGTALTHGAIFAARQVTRAIERTPEARQTFFDPRTFPFTARIEENWHVIRQELDAVMRGVEMIPNFQDLMPEQRELTTDDRWKTFIFYGYGVKFEGNCHRCPETTRLLQGIPGMTSAMFSILRGHKHLPAHSGHYKGVLRYHLGLIVPEPADQCVIRVGQDKASWQEGRSLIFDDTHDHEVWKENDGDRVVLFLDFLRPLPPVLDALNRMVVKLIGLSPYIYRSEQNSRRWEEYFGQEFDLLRNRP
ncbi:aspartyl/asparaginyl beta-hydroxylase domain-containing protein [Corallococcus sp. CA053C]|uniref:aspartyl/asparaginyl beta-hydroxylase domain-containing protein n=1 Tax=Corallococcus sp. CA053C TaxID=2316732 RepID=UPI000EA0B16D|nr:aspartyl/asparaginyl beta-hydroxylase domain-containing protein [Corallococcus sp. CA053C]RKH12565.1 aspartyl/asparaginyl beta-hydroxylase domain-containing protein [Corallococcus sp. CA053C]